jgi:hypothetical protein
MRCFLSGFALSFFSLFIKETFNHWNNIACFMGMIFYRCYFLEIFAMNTGNNS